MKKKLPSFEEISYVQREPFRDDRWITDVTPIRTEEVLENVRQSMIEEDNAPQQLINNPQDAPVINQQERGGHRTVVLPRINEEALQLQQERICDFSNEDDVRFYNLLCATFDNSQVPFDESRIGSQSNNYVTYITDMNWNYEGRNYIGSEVVFNPIRGFCMSRKFTEDFVSEYADGLTLLTAEIDKDQLQVYEIQKRVSNGEEMDLTVYFKKVFIMLSVLQQLELFTNGVGRERFNTSHVNILWTEKYLQHSLATGTNASIGIKFDRRMMIISYLNVKRMILVSRINGQLRYFQVKFVGNKTYVIANAFPKELTDQPLGLPIFNERGFDNPRILDVYEFSTDIHNRMYEPFNRPTEAMFEPSYSTRMYQHNKRLPEVREYKIVDFTFEFCFPRSFVQHVVDGQERFYPISFRESEELLNRCGVGTDKDTLVFTVESWEIFRNFLLTVLFPEEYELPPPQVPDQNINEEAIEHVDMPIEQQPMLPLEQQPPQGFVQQPMEIEDASGEHQE